MQEDIDSGLTEVRSAGHMGMGLFAKQDISRGTLIFAESPILSTPKQDTREDTTRLCSEIEAMTPKMRSRLDQLYCHKANILPAFREVAREWIKEHKMKDFDTKAEDQSQSKQNQARTGMKDPDDSIVTGEKAGSQSASQHPSDTKTKFRSKMKKIQNMTKAMNKRIAIFRSNCVAMGAKSEYGVGVFHRYSRINHSCLPNVNNRYSPRLKQLTVYATRDIKADEQILVSYIKAQCRSRAVRREELAVWGFTCSCLACTDPEKEVVRRRMAVLDQRLASYQALSELDDVDSPLLAVLIAEAVKVRGGQTSEDALRDAQELAKLQEEQGLRGMELALTYRECSLHSLESGRLAQAVEYAEKEEQEERASIGINVDLRNNPNYAEYWLRRLRMQQILERLERSEVGHVEELSTSDSEE